MGKSTALESERRIEVARLEILEAEDPSWIVPNLAVKFGVSERMARNYVRAARKRITDAARFVAGDMLAEHISVRRIIRKRSMEVGDHKTALASAIDEAKLFNLYPASRHEVMLDWRDEARKHGIQDPDRILQQVIDTAVAGLDDAGGDDGDSETEGDGDEAAPEE
jgi:hypothetical protein